MLFQDKKIKIFFIALFLAIAMGGSFAAMLLINNKSDSALARLNFKYRLISAEPLDQKADSRFLSLFTLSRFLQANLIDPSKPERELILKLNSSSSDADLQDVFILNLKTDENIQQVMADYENLDIVKYAEPNFNLSIPEDKVTPAADPKKQEVSKITLKNEVDVLVAIIDSGVDSAHPDFAGRIVSGWNFLNDTRQAIDQDGHGTHVGGVILKNSFAAKIMPLKVSDGKNGKIKELARAIKFATDNGAQIINLSLGLQSESKVLREAIDYANERNVIVVAAAGNNHSSKEFYPAAFPNVVAVSALKKNGKKLFSSNFGEWVDFSAVAQDLWSAAPNKQHAYRSGTSQAAAVVSAAIADLLAASGEMWNFEKTRNYLTESAEPIAGRYPLGRQITKERVK